MTADQLYNMGYEDGKKGKSANAHYVSDLNYQMGYEDGKGDAEKNRPVGDEYKIYNDPPAGFEFTGEKRVPLPNEWYLSKNGNPTYLPRPRRNNQKRHILRPIKGL